MKLSIEYNGTNSHLSDFTALVTVSLKTPFMHGYINSNSEGNDCLLSD